MDIEIDDNPEYDAEAHAASDEQDRIQKLHAVETILGVQHQLDEKFHISFEQAEELLRNGHLDVNIKHDRGATHAGVIELLKTHNDLRASGIHSATEGVILNGFEVRTEESFSQESIRDFFDYAFKYADDYEVSPHHLFMRFSRYGM